MNRTKGILAAGTFTGLILITILALGFGRVGRSEALSTAGATAAPTIQSAAPASSQMVDVETLQAWQEYSAQLELTIRAMQQRDAAYQQQLEAANRTILELQNQINSRPAPSIAGERESGEHEAFEFGAEHDD